MIAEKLMKVDESGSHLNSDHVDQIQSEPNLNAFSNSNIQKGKSKKSYNLLSAFVRRTKLKTKKSKGPNKDESNLKFISSNSSFGSHSGEEIEILVENIDKKLEDIKELKGKKSVDLSDSEHSLLPSNKTKKKFFSKFLVKHGSTENEKYNLDNLSSSGGDVKIQENKNTSIRKSVEKVNTFKNVSFFPISFIKFEKPTLPTSLIQGLFSLKTIASQLQHSENYLLHIFKQYITDVNLQKELIDSLCVHSKLHLETERMTRNLSMEMWSKQLEIEKAQQNAMQDALAAVIKQNRQLLSEYENLFLTYEKLLSKFQCFITNCDATNAGCEEEIQEVIKHNVDLIHKIEGLCKQIEYFEAELITSTKQNDHLEHQLTDVSGQLHDLEVTFHQTKAASELEIAALNHQLKGREKIFADAVNACSNLEKDVDSMRDQLKCIPFEVDWTKLMCRKEELINCIDVGRMCINELTKEVVNLKNQVSLKERDIETLVETNRMLHENLRKSTTELDSITGKIDDSGQVLSEHRYKLLETEAKINLEKLERLKFEYEMEKSSLLRKIQHYEELQKEQQNMFEQSKIYIATLTSENLIIRNQLDGLNKTLNENNAVDVFAKMDNHLEKPVFTEVQYNQLLIEKQYLLEQQEIIKQKYQKILDSQEIRFAQFQTQQNDHTNHLSSENKALTQKYEAEQKTVLSLQSERKKYLEERSLLKIVFEHMKNEISRLQKLEGAVADISKEANKLAVVAKYNKDLGKKLKTEIEEKDKIIVKLRTSVEKLNDIQIKDAKEKLSLCFELTELTQMKEKVDTELSWELQKNLALDEVKNEIVQSTNSQIKEFEKVQKKERIAFKELLKDLKVVTKQRNALLVEKEAGLNELTNMKQLNQEHSKQNEQLLLAIEENERKSKYFQKKHEEDNVRIARLQDKLNMEVKTYVENVKQLEKLIIELRKEKVTMEDSIKYLQNNVQKLHNDLNTSRSNEKDLKDSLNRCLAEKLSLQEAATNAETRIESLNSEKESLSQELNKINGVCEKILADFEINLKKTVEKEELLNKELNEKKIMIISTDLQNEQLVRELVEKEEKLHHISEEYSNLKTSEAEYDNVKVHLHTAREECESLYEQIKKADEQKQTEIRKYQREVDDLLKQNAQLQDTNQILTRLKLDVSELTEKLEQERASYTALSEIHKEVSDKFMETIKSAEEEKEAREAIETQLKETTKHLECLKSEKSDLQQQINVLLDGLNDTKNRINTLVQDKEICQKSKADLQKRYNEVLTRCISLESDVRRVQDNSTVNKEELRVLREENEKLKRESQDNQKTIFSLRQDIAEYQQQLIELEFQKSEITLRLHEVQRKYESEMTLCDQLHSIQNVTINTISTLKENGLVDAEQCKCLINLVRNITNSDLGAKS